MGADNVLDLTLEKDPEIRIAILGGHSFTDFTVDLAGQMCGQRYAEKKRSVVLEMWGVKYCNSMALAMLLRLQRQLAKDGFKVILELGDVPFSSFLKMMKIDEFLEIRMVHEGLDDGFHEKAS
jgi:anti-anti-sigma regulatory factor